MTAGENLLAVEVHQKHEPGKPSSDLMLDLELALRPAVGEFLCRSMGDDRATVISALKFALPEFAPPERLRRWDAALAEDAPPEATAEDLEVPRPGAGGAGTMGGSGGGDAASPDPHRRILRALRAAPEAGLMRPRLAC